MPPRLFKQFILRPLTRELLRTASTIVGIALGVAVVVAIRLANASSIAGFETALEATAGRTSIEIRGAAGGIPEDQLRALVGLRDIGIVSPVIEGDMAVDLGGGRTEAMRVLGVDILRDRPFRDYRLLHLGGNSDGGPESLEVTTQRFLELLTDERGVILTQAFASRHRVSVGDELRLIAGDRIASYHVRGLLADEGPARLLDGNFILMDIAAAQLALGRLGRVDRVDVLLPASADVSAALETVAARLPHGLAAQRPSRRGEQVEHMLAAFQLNLSALSWIALIVGLFLVYNTVTISVLARREEIGTLRALGTTRRQVLALFLGEAAALGATGAVAGLLLARVLADAAIALTATTVKTLYIASASAPPAIGAGHVALAFALGVLLSLAAAAVPAWEASRVAPTSAMRGSDRLEMRYRLRPIFLVGPVALVAVTGGLATLGPVGGVPIFGYAASLTAVAAASLLVPAILFGVTHIARRALRRLLGVEGLLAHANLAAAIPRLSISVAALAVSLSMMVAVAVMIGSFRETVIYWAGQTLRADLYIGPAVRPTASSEQTLSQDVIDIVRRHPDVEAVDLFRSTETTYDGNLVLLNTGRFDVLVAHARLLFKSPADAATAMRQAAGEDAVVVSEPFANRYGRSVGDRITLATPEGDRTFRIAAVYYDYSSDRGAVMIDRGTFERYWGDLPPTGASAYLKADASADRVRDDIMAAVGDARRVFIYTNRTLRDEVLRVFDSTFAITYALEIIAIVVAMLGVAGTLLTLVLERRRDLTLLRLIGADRRQIQRMVVAEAATIGATSQVVGLGIGLGLSLVLIFVINVQSFGWTIQFHVPLAFLLHSSLAVIAATAAAGFYPARRAARLGVLREE